MKQPSAQDMQQQIRSHVESDDLFGTEATIVELARQDIKKRGFTPMHDAMLEKVRDELVYLQHHYELVEKKIEIVQDSVKDRIKRGSRLGGPDPRT